LHNNNTLFDELSKFTGSDIETRAENAFNVSVKFMKLMESECVDEKAFDLKMKAWFRAIKDNDFSKFKRVYRKYSDR
jgi:hypothetical protein